MVERPRQVDPVYNTEEVHVLRLARHFKDMGETEWWREYAKVLQAQIVEREKLLLTPLGDQHPAFEGLDFTTRAVKLEAIKGAIIGLRLALSIPSDTMSHADAIRAEHSLTKDDDDAE